MFVSQLVKFKLVSDEQNELIAGVFAENAITLKSPFDDI